MTSDTFLVRFPRLYFILAYLPKNMYTLYVQIGLVSQNRT